MPRSPETIIHADGKARCPWPGTDAFYVAYHDTDWGVPERDSRALFEKLVLDGFQAGLAWVTILRKREHFRKVFDNFDASVIVDYGPEKIEALMADPGIVRNRMKIEGTVASARAFLEIEAREGFSTFLWRYVDGRPIRNTFRHMRQVPAKTELAERISKDLKAAGFAFCGPTIVYAFMQAVGMVNDHLVGCFRHAECAALGEAM